MIIIDENPSLLGESYFFHKSLNIDYLIGLSTVCH